MELNDNDRLRCVSPVSARPGEGRVTIRFADFVIVHTDR
jgi:hypothetical protein